jgi:hypothetical protein
MGVEYKAKLLVGLPYEKLEEFLDGKDPEDFGLDYASPYYDSDPSEWIVGVEVASTEDFSWCEVDVHEHKKAFEKFKEITGLVGELILSPHGH